MHASVATRRIANRRRTLVGLALLGLAGCSGQLVAIRLKGQDKNPSAYYVCVPASEGPRFECRSGRALHAFDRVLDAGGECPQGIVAEILVETDAHGSVTRIQYVCSVPPIDGFPGDAPTTTGEL